MSYLGTMTFRIMTLSITTYSIMTLSTNGLFSAFSIKTLSRKDKQHNKCAIMPSVFMLSDVTYYYAEWLYAECCYAEHRVPLIKTD
jgi:hypothetical protein